VCVLRIVVWHRPAAERWSHARDVRSLIEVCGILVKIEARSAVPEGGSERIFDRCFERDNLRAVVSLLHRLRIEGLKFSDTLLQPLNTPTYLISSQD
jgi:hypothetical protein